MNCKLTVEGKCFYSVTSSQVELYYVAVVRAKNLLALDPNGCSDPYCIITVDGSTEQQKKTEIMSATLEPEWNKSFEFSVTPPHMWNSDSSVGGGPVSHYVKLEMWDHDMLNRDDFMGMVMIPLVDITDDQQPCWYNLTRSSSKQVVTGEIKMNVYYSTALVSVLLSY